MTMEQILGIVRHVLTAVGGAGVTAGYFTTDELTAIVGGAVALVGVVWSWAVKRETV